MYTSFASLTKFTPSYFIVCGVIASKIIYLIFYLDCWLFKYKNVANLGLLILYPASLLNFLAQIDIVWARVFCM